MQVLITHGSVARTRVLHFNRLQILAAAFALVCALLLLSGTVYHFVFLKAARDGWPVVSSIVRLVVRDEIKQRERFMRDNLDAMAQRVGEVEAKMVRLESVSERVSGLAGIRAEELRVTPAAASAPAARPAANAGVRAPGASGGPYVPLPAVLAGGTTPTLEALLQRIAGLDAAADLHTDLFTLVESRFTEARLLSLMVPNSAPIDGPVGSGFGFRSDPFTGRAALHTGLDFPADSGAPIHAAAGGLVVLRESHPAYGLTLEIDHGNGLATRYAHCSSIEVEQGALVKRGQLVARVGSSGRSTGPHLHFEVLVAGVPQNPARFLAAQPALPALVAAQAARSAR
jgi:murein DD-endopeptidase MepM/ murein hydrolase activator NlpD